MALSAPTVNQLQTGIASLAAGTEIQQAIDAATANGFAAGGISTGSLLSSSPSAGVGYSPGAGGAVTQITNRTTGVTLNTISGQITTVNNSLAVETGAAFVVTNSAVGLHDVVALSIQSGSNSGNTSVITQVTTAGSFTILVSNNNAAGGTAETGAIIINFVVLKGASA